MSESASDARHPAPGRGLRPSRRFVGGMLVAVQSRINGRARRSELGDGFVAAIISFASGLVILASSLAVCAAGRRGFARLRRGAPRAADAVVDALGGVARCAASCSPRSLVGRHHRRRAVHGRRRRRPDRRRLLLDRIGLGPDGAVAAHAVPRRSGPCSRWSPSAVAVSAQLRADVPLWMLVLPVPRGRRHRWQQAVNGGVREIAGSPLTATVVNFVVGTVVLAVALLVHLSFGAWPDALPDRAVALRRRCDRRASSSRRGGARAHHRRAPARPRGRRPASSSPRSRSTCCCAVAGPRARRCSTVVGAGARARRRRSSRRSAGAATRRGGYSERQVVLRADRLAPAASSPWRGLPPT